MLLVVLHRHVGLVRPEYEIVLARDLEAPHVRDCVLGRVGGETVLVCIDDVARGACCNPWGRAKS